jgi:tRNA A37 threonylcarbamoyladenosine biosynthesis protein TsaE
VNKAQLGNLIQERRIIIIAGSNGAGKTTFAREFLQEGSHEKNQKGYPR